jgi:competence protein ComEA
MKKILFSMLLSLSFLSALNLQTASKDDLMCIKGIGEKKANAIIKYRKSNTLKSADDLLEIKGFGQGLAKNVKNNTKSVACGGKKTSKSKTTNKSTTKKSNSKKSSKPSKSGSKKMNLQKKNLDSK